MPAMLEDPSAATIYRVTGEAPFPDPSRPSLPPTIQPRHVTLRDRQTVATVLPFASRHQVPESLLRYLNDQFNKEIEGGDTYPMMDTLPFDKFASYWFQNFAGIMLLGNIESAEELAEGKDWSKECLGTFYIKPNYPGRSSHVCNAGFIVTDASRNRGVGRLMGEAYLDWAPKLGYTYSVFNLVYETNVASCKIWDALGFKRIGRVKGAGSLKSYPDRFVDAVIFGRDLGDAAGGAGSEELVSEERFDKIKFYLKYGRYPNGADRAEKSRLRSAATHYKLLDGDVLMLKDKEVISDPQRQYEIARSVHNQTHAGINKTTATIAERYHWSRIKETVSDVIRNCTECKELGKTSSSSQSQNQAQPSPGAAATTTVIGVKRPSQNVSPGVSSSKRSSPSPPAVNRPPLDTGSPAGGPPLRPAMPTLPDPSSLNPFAMPPHTHPPYSGPAEDMTLLPPGHQLQPGTADTAMTDHHGILTRHAQNHNPMLQESSQGPLHQPHHHHHHHHHVTAAHPHVTLPPLSHPLYQPIDPQIISQPTPTSDPHAHTLQHHHHHHPHFSFEHTSPHHPGHGPHHDPDADTFQALLNAADDDDDINVDMDPEANGSRVTAADQLSRSHHNRTLSSGTNRLARLQRTAEEEQEEAEQQAAVDRDLDMLIEQPQDDEDDDDHRHHRNDNGASGGNGSGGEMDLDVVLGPTDDMVSVGGVGPPDGHSLFGNGSGSSGSSNGKQSQHTGTATTNATSIASIVSIAGLTGVTSSSSANPSINNNMGKMDVSHLLSAHDDEDDDHDGNPMLGHRQTQILQQQQQHIKSTRTTTIYDVVTGFEGGPG